jgi:hypothetical protein
MKAESEGAIPSFSVRMAEGPNSDCKGGYTLVTLPRIVTPYRVRVDGTRDRVTYQKLVTL